MLCYVEQTHQTFWSAFPVWFLVKPEWDVNMMCLLLYEMAEYNEEIGEESVTF